MTGGLLVFLALLGGAPSFAQAGKDGAAGSDEDRLRGLASLRAPVGRFFDDVLVMAEDARVRANRLFTVGTGYDGTLRGSTVGLVPGAGGGARSYRRRMVEPVTPKDDPNS